jgi:hypothetical protein
MSSISVDEDPLDMFGGTPIPSITLHSSHVGNNNNNQNVDFFADFSEAPTAAAPTPVVQEPSNNSNSIPSSGIHDYAEIDLAEDTIHHHTDSDAAPSTKLQKSSSTTPLRTSSTRSSTSFRERLSEQPASTKASHKAFQYLDAKQAGGAGAAAAAQQNNKINRLDSGGSGSTSIEDYHDQQQQQQKPPSSSHGNTSSINPTTEGVVELGQRAAKALQAGTKWFMKASKQIATEVQSKLEKHRQHQNYDHNDSTSSGGGMTTSHSFYFDWASQIARMSPGTRAAAMGAMQEDDRLEVQRIIDDAELGEVMLNSVKNKSSSNIGMDNRNGRRDSSSGPLGEGIKKVPDWTSSDEDYVNTTSCEQQRELELERELEQQRREEVKVVPPPPSYDELMGSASGKTGGSTPVAPARVVVEHEEDLLGLSGKRRSTAATSAAAAPAAEVLEDDLLRMDGDNTTDNVNANSNGGTGHIDDLFTVSKPGAAPALASRACSTATASAVAVQRSSGFSSMIDLEDALPDVDTTGYSELYTEKESGGAGRINGVGGGGEDSNEPAIRKVLREKRIAEKHERMKQQLAEKRAREEAEDAEKAGKVAFRDTLKPKIDAWAANKKDNIRALLSTVHTVLWEDSGWTAPSIADMVDPAKVKKWYMKANLVVHPDKVKQKGGTLEQVATADMVFDVLKGAWGKFEASK